MPSVHVLPPVTRIIPVLILFAVLVSGQSTPALKPGKVEGLVTNSVTGDPVRKATVTLIGSTFRGGHSAVTDSAGHFQFESVEPGTYQAVAAGDGFMQEQSRHGAIEMKPVTVAEDQQVKGLVVKLIPLATVNGHVFDEDGDPVARAQVQALRYVYRQGGSRQLNGAGWASTNDLGEFQMLDLEPGRYYFLASVQPRFRNLPPRIHGAGPEQTYPATYYPSAMQAAQATASQLAPGAQLSNIDFRIHKVPAYHVRGKAIESATGQPVRNAQVHIQPREGMSFGNAQVLENGTFDARGVVSGSYNLILQSNELSTQQPLNVGDHDVDDIVLTLRPQVQISGIVRWEGAAAHPEQVQVGLIADMTGYNWAPVNADGSFTLKAIPAIYRVMAGCNAGGYVKSIRFGDQDITKGEIDLTQSAGGALNILCGVDVGRLQGTVQNENGEPAANAIVTISPDGEHRGDQFRFLQLATDQNGKLEYADFAPGDYKVFAWEGAETEMFQSDEFQKAFAAKGASVSIPPGGSATVQLKMISAAEIEAEKNKLP